MAVYKQKFEDVSSVKYLKTTLKNQNIFGRSRLESYNANIITEDLSLSSIVKPNGINGLEESKIMIAVTTYNSVALINEYKSCTFR